MDGLISYRAITHDLVPSSNTESKCAKKLTSTELQKACARGAQDGLAILRSIRLEFAALALRPGHEKCRAKYLDALDVVLYTFGTVQTGAA